jgi:hypothetical protein
VLTFVVGTAADVFPPEFASAVEALLEERYGFGPADGDEPYRSEGVNGAGWRELQELATSMLGQGAAPHLTRVEAYQAVYLPKEFGTIDQVAVPNAADPIHVASLPALVSELSEFASRAQLPTDELELMGLAADYLEAESDKELDFQTYVQLMLSAKQAMARKQPLWVVT